jgi:enoyl-CoA hydratase/carnithine racemase
MEFIEVKRDGPVAIVYMNHAAENTFTGPFVDEIMKTLDELEKDPEVKAVVFTGAVEKYFSNGLNLGWVASQSKDDMIEFLVYFNDMLRRAATFPMPTVAAVNGHAFAGGFFLACCMDFRFMRKDRGWLCVPEVDLGLSLPPGTVALLEHVMGAKNVNNLALTGKRITGLEAKELGIVHQVYGIEELMDRSVEFAKGLTLKRTENYAEIKSKLKAGVARVMKESDAEMIRGEVLKVFEKKGI